MCVRREVSVNLYKCDVCGSKFLSNDSLMFHKRNHALHRTYKYDLCKESFIKLSEMKKHKITHAGGNLFECVMCNKKCIHYSSNSHIKNHTAVKPDKSDTCSKGFNISGDMKKHKIKQANNKPYKWEVCYKRFIHRSDLMRHIRKKQVTSLTNLYVHKRIHTGVKPYKCDVCDKEFNRSSRLTGDKTY
jgi:KRAB domain-containing zinc finger protein